MNSYSQGLIFPAVVISCLLHLLIIGVLNRCFRMPEDTSYPVISVRLNRGNIPPALSMPQTDGPAFPVSDPPVEVASPEIREKIVPILPEAVPVLTESVPDAVPPLKPDITENAPGREAAEEERPLTGLTGKGEDADGPAGSDTGSSESGPVAESLDDSLQLEWTGRASRLKEIPELTLHFPRTGMIYEQVIIRFRVLQDGTVATVKVLPPGSGNLSLDRQISTFVTDLLFEEDRSAEDFREGSLILNLTKMENREW